MQRRMGLGVVGAPKKLRRYAGPFFLLSLPGLAIVVVLLFLMMLGLPPNLKNQLTDQLSQNGRKVELADLRLHPLRGVVGRGFEWQGNAEDVCVLLQADEVALSFNYKDWLQRDWGLKQLDVCNGVMQICIDPERKAGGDSDLEVRNMRGRLAVEGVWVAYNRLSWNVSAGRNHRSRIYSA